MPVRSAWWRRLVPALALAFLFGCSRSSPSTQAVVWSPNGQRAALIARDGLYLVAADGTLSPLIAPDVYDAAWLGDSQRLLIARRREVNDFSAIAAAVGPERTHEIVVKAEAIWEVMAPNAQITFDERLETLAENTLVDLNAAVLYLRDTHGDDFWRRLEESAANEAGEITVELNGLVLARVAGDRLEPGATLYEDLHRILGIRPSPGDHAVALVTAAPELLSETASDWREGDLRLLLVPVDRSASAALVASQTSSSPDWTPHERSLLYLESSSDEQEGRFGWLVEQNVLDANNRVKPVDGEHLVPALAKLMFNDASRLRCLPDGRVLFNAAEVHLPTSDFSARDQLFVLDRLRTGAPILPLTPLVPRTTLERLPASLSSFEVSPDSTKVLLAGENEVLVLTLANGNIERFPQGVTGFDNPQLPLPVWRGPGEFTYIKKVASRNELVLRRGNTEIVLSWNWPDRMLQRPSAETTGQVPLTK